MKFKKFFKLILFTGLASVLVVMSTILWLYTAYDVAKLLKSYPVYDLTSDTYIFENKKPHNWSFLKEISHEAKWAVVVSEDWAFFDHSGIDFRQLGIVLEESMKEKELVRGASTISQQVVKNVFLSQDRTLWRKFKEMLLTFKLERLVSKDKILEVYLNIVELGKDIYGIKKASAYYFNVTPAELTAREGAFLAMLLPSPVKYSVSFRNKELSEFADHQIKSILLKLRQAKILTEEERLESMESRFSWEKKIEPEYPDPENLENDYYDFNVYSEDGVGIHRQP